MTSAIDSGDGQCDVACPDCGKVRKAYPRHLATVESIDQDNKTAVCCCLSCSGKRNGHASAEKIKDKGVTVDGKLIRGEKALQIHMEFMNEHAMALRTPEEHQEYTAVGHASNRGRTRTEEQRLLITLMSMSPDHEGTAGPCWRCRKLAYAHHLQKGDEDPFFHLECRREYWEEQESQFGEVLWPPLRPKHLPTNQKVTTALKITVLYYQWRMGENETKGESGPKLAIKYGFTLPGLLGHIDDFVDNLPQDGRGGKRVTQWSEVLINARNHLRKNRSKVADSQVESVVAEDLFQVGELDPRLTLPEMLRHLLAGNKVKDVDQLTEETGKPRTQVMNTLKRLHLDFDRSPSRYRNALYRLRTNKV